MRPEQKCKQVEISIVELCAVSRTAHTHTLNIPPSTHCQLLFWAFFLPPTFYSVPTFPKAAFCALVGPQAPSRPPHHHCWVSPLALFETWSEGERWGLDWIHVLVTQKDRHCYIHGPRNHCKTCTCMQCANYTFNRVELLQYNFWSPNCLFLANHQLLNIWQSST